MFLFDFDGVMIDSTPEIMVSAYNTVTSSIITDQENIPDIFKEKFLRSRAHARNAADMVALAEIILNHPDWLGDLSQHRLEEFRKTCGSVVKLQKALFDARAVFLKKDPDSWYAHNVPFEPLWSLLRDGHFKNFVIVTNKNRKAVLNLCRRYELEVPAERILSGDAGISKLARILTYLNMEPAERVMYFEDAVGNLEEVVTGLSDRVSIIPVLVTWGELAEGDRARAEQIKARLVCLEEEELLNCEKFLI